MKNRKIFIWSVLVIIFLLCITYLWVIKYNPIKAISCEFNRDNYRRGFKEGHITFICAEVYNDGGKKCLSSNECEGDCVVDNGNNYICEAEKNYSDAKPLMIEELKIEF